MAIIASTHSEAATLTSSRSDALRTAPVMSRGAEPAQPREPVKALTRNVIEALMHVLAKMSSHPSRDHPKPTTAKEPLHARHRA